MGEVKSSYSGRNYYKVFGVRPDAPLKEIQRAYRVLALKVHPDRNNNSAESTRDFQELAKMMEVLSDPNSRAIYDQTGDDIRDDNFGDLRGAMAVFRRVTRADIEAYSAAYYGSEQEAEDVLFAYENFQGDFEKMLEWIPLSSPDRLPQYEEIIGKAIKESGAKVYKMWASAKDASKKYADEYANEAQEAEIALSATAQKYTPFLPAPSTKRKSERAKNKANMEDGEDKGMVVGGGGGGGLLVGGLAAGMRAREAARHLAMVESMEARYGKKGQKRGKRKHESLPSEEEFMKIQRRLLKSKRNKTV